ncbi:hypothetical protein E2320_002037 [Naja naja]|nr:hypothetical protein E2320_002037 [Naja naja]
MQATFSICRTCSQPHRASIPLIPVLEEEGGPAAKHGSLLPASSIAKMPLHGRANQPPAPQPPPPPPSPPSDAPASEVDLAGYNKEEMVRHLRWEEAEKLMVLAQHGRLIQGMNRQLQEHLRKIHKLKAINGWLQCPALQRCQCTGGLTSCFPCRHFALAGAEQAMFPAPLPPPSLLGHLSRPPAPPPPLPPLPATARRR